VESTIDKTDTGDPSALSTMATAMSKGANETSHESNELAALVPPAALARSWAGYVSAIDTEGRLLAVMAEDARQERGGDRWVADD
jgi:hypothetical protein